MKIDLNGKLFNEYKIILLWNDMNLSEKQDVVYEWFY